MSYGPDPDPRRNSFSINELERCQSQSLSCSFNMSHASQTKNHTRLIVQIAMSPIPANVSNSVVVMMVSGLVVLVLYRTPQALP